MDVQFNEPTAQTPLAAQQQKGITKLVIGWGLAKDEAGAQKVLLITIVICVALIGALMVFGGEDVEPLPPDAFYGM